MNLLLSILPTLSSCLNSDLVYYDYFNGQGFDLSALVESGPWRLDHGDFFIEFMIGDKVLKMCQGIQASVVRFYKDGLKCEIL